MPRLNEFQSTQSLLVQIIELRKELIFEGVGVRKYSIVCIVQNHAAIDNL